MTIEEGDTGYCYVDGVIESDHSGFLGAGYANGDNETDTQIAWHVNASSAGEAVVDVRFANGAGSSRSAALSVNDADNGMVDFAASAWTDWQLASQAVNLQRGDNLIVLTSTSADGLPNIDSLTVRGAQISRADCPLPPPEPVAVDTNRWYLIENKASNLVMDIASESDAEGAQLTQWNQTDAENQQFRFEQTGEDYYRIVAKHSSLVLDLFEASTEDGAEIVQWQSTDRQNQDFQVLDLKNGYYHIVNRESQKALAPAGFENTAGQRVSQYQRSNEEAQQWQLVDHSAYLPDVGEPGECGAGTPDALVTGSSGSYSVNGRGVGSNFRSAIQAALDSLSRGRSQQERVTVMADGSIGNSYIELPSNTIFEVCGTINVGSSNGRGAIQAIGVRNVSIPHLRMTGSPYFGMHFADIDNLHLGRVELRLSGGLGIRFARDLPGSTDVRMDDIYVEGTNNHGVETWNINGLEIGRVVARDTAYAGLLLNNTRNAMIGLVDGDNTGAGTGYATLRFANTNGRIGGGWPTNIYVDRVISRGGGRGFFCVSNSGGAVINNIDFADNGSNAILIENCHNITINGGTIDGGGEVRIAARDEFPNTSDVTIRDVVIRNTSVRESPCGNNITWDVDTNGRYDVCD